MHENGSATPSRKLHMSFLCEWALAKTQRVEREMPNGGNGGGRGGEEINRYLEETEKTAA